MVRNKPVKLPKDVVSVILEYEGGMIRAWQLDFCKGVYVEAYKRYFGGGFAFRQISRSSVYLPFYVHMACALRKEPTMIRYRKSRQHLRPWKRVFPAQCRGLSKKGINDGAGRCVKSIVEWMSLRPLEPLKRH